MKLQWTRIAEGEPLGVEILIADNADPTQATSMLHVRMSSDTAKSNWHLPAIHREVLERVQEALVAEIRAARSALDRAQTK
jgi:hypothetical protein